MHNMHVQYLQGEDSEETSEAGTCDLNRVSASSTSRRWPGRARGIRARGSARARRTSSTSAGGRSGGRRSTTSSTAASTESSLAAREKAVDAALDAVGESGGSSWRAVALVALGGTLVGVDGLGGIGAGIAQAGGLAGHIGGRALVDALDGRGELGSSSGGDGGSAGDGSSLGGGKSANGESEDNGVLHGDYRGRVTRELGNGVPRDNGIR